MQSKWIKISIPCQNNQDIEEFSYLVASTIEKPVIENENSIEIFVEESEYQNILEKIKPLGINPSSEEIFSYDEKDWVEEWKKSIKPILIGNLFIKPSWRNEEDPSKVTITIDPGMAFGTGHHESTRLCLEWIDRFSSSHKDHLFKLSFLDVGTGSGILAIASAKMGFKEIVAIDIDEEALNVARKNATENGISSITFLYGTPQLLNSSFDIVMANIQANVIVDMADELIRTTKPFGRLVLSGILYNQSAYVKRVFIEKGLTLLGISMLGEWIMLDFKKIMV